MSNLKEETSLVLAKDSDPELVKRYFTKILELKQSGKDYPINLDIVFEMVYNRKQEAVRVLKSDFVENVDYQALRRNAQRGASSPIDYYLTVECLEYFIAKKVKPVFEVYRKVFHAAIANQTKSLAETATYIENQVFLSKLGNKTIKSYYTNGVLYYSQSAIMLYLGYAQGGGVVYASKYPGSIKVEDGKMSLWMVNREWVDALTNSINYNGPFEKISILYRDLFKVEINKDGLNEYVYRFTESEMNSIFTKIFRMGKPGLQTEILNQLAGGRL